MTKNPMVLVAKNADKVYMKFIRTGASHKSSAMQSILKELEDIHVIYVNAFYASLPMHILFQISDRSIFLNERFDLLSSQ